MLIDFLQTMFNVILVLAALRFAQGYVLDKNPQSTTGSALSYLLH